MNEFDRELLGLKGVVMADSCPNCGHDFDACICGGMGETARTVDAPPVENILKNLLKNLDKLKVREADLYLLALRQLLLNQSELLVHNNKGGHAYQYANDSRRLAERIGEFIDTKQ